MMRFKVRREPYELLLGDPPCSSVSGSTCGGLIAKTKGTAARARLQAWRHSSRPSSMVRLSIT